MLHFAGGNRYSFEFIKPLLGVFEVEVLELPGRGGRMNEKLIKDFETASYDIFSQLSGKLESPDFLIYGHSMGAYLTLKVASMLENKGTPPLAIIVSGNIGPTTKRNTNVMRHTMEKDQFITELEKLGGVPDEIISNPEFFNYFEPILRADFEIAENNELEFHLPINLPIFAIMGSQEDRVAEINNWGRFTTSEFDSAVLEGNHFFIHHHAKKIASIIKTCYGNAKNNFMFHENRSLPES